MNLKIYVKYIHIITDYKKTPNHTKNTKLNGGLIKHMLPQKQFLKLFGIFQDETGISK